MLLIITDYLRQFHSGFNVFHYLTFRAILGTLTALMISLWVGPAMIRRLASYKIGQNIRNDGPETHLSKSGTPTMGGSLILVAVAVSTLLWSDLDNRQVWIALVVTLLFGGIGFVDDYKKLTGGSSKGLSAKAKYFWQTVFGLGAAIFMYNTAQQPIETTLIVPFFKDVMIPLGVWFIALA